MAPLQYFTSFRPILFFFFFFFWLPIPLILADLSRSILTLQAPHSVHDMVHLSSTYVHIHTIHSTSTDLSTQKYMYTSLADLFPMLGTLSDEHLHVIYHKAHFHTAKFTTVQWHVCSHACMQLLTFSQT